MHTFDLQVPPELKRLQCWFGKVISTPLGPDCTIAKFGPNKCKMDKEAARFVVKSQTLQPEQRMEIYNQQYWFRLINTMQDFYPLLVRLFGYTDFNESIAIPYLKDHPPQDWSLNPLGDKLPDWIKLNYKLEDRQLVFDAAQLDQDFHQVFFPKRIVLEETVTEDFLEKPLILQPHVTLHNLPYNLFSFRRDLLMESPDYWIENPFPELPKGEFHFCLFRNRSSNIQWRVISPVELLLMKELQKGITLDDLCEFLENQEESIRAEAETSLETWFKDWTLHGIIAAKD